MSGKRGEYIVCVCAVGSLAKEELNYLFVRVAHRSGTGCAGLLLFNQRGGLATRNRNRATRRDLFYLSETVLLLQPYLPSFPSSISVSAFLPPAIQFLVVAFRSRLTADSHLDGLETHTSISSFI